ncbi:Fic family protein [Nocardioides terrae]|uniref:Fic family protein n=1 Tax=Nocardioides terrae TaxID=574651 RepID=A0A1I1F2X3_9ACTN|nr:Fic family protein [Nocardioides terrae]SFB93607.1 Fic family protein [Nocardioides terrae]
MAHWERIPVAPDFAGTTRSERHGGSYLRYHPDLLLEVSNALPPAVIEYAADVSTGLARLGGRLAANPLPVLYATTLLSESISSSWIEGIRATPRDVAIAQIGEPAATRAGSPAAGQIVRNIAAMKEAIEVLGSASWEQKHLCDIHHQLLPWHRVGYREEQVWIGGTNSLNADYAGPPADRVDALMDDLLKYANTSGELPIILAAIVHAQFETVHPFEDGNGRVGRALVHGVLRRAGLIDGGVISLSTAMRHDEEGYIAALTRYRYDGDRRATALASWVEQFLTYVEVAIAATSHFVDAAVKVQERWRQAIRGTRSDAALHRALDLVGENPVVSARFVSENLNITASLAHRVLKQLEAVEIVKPASGKYRRSQLFQADDILNLVSLGAEGDARTTPPAIQAASSGAELTARCGAPTAHGSCRNRVVKLGDHCWRHAG